MRNTECPVWLSIDFTIKDILLLFSLREIDAEQSLTLRENDKIQHISQCLLSH